MAGEISVIYADNPWGDLSMLERYPTYVPNLLANYRRASKWGRFVGSQIDFTAMRTRQMVLSRQLDGEPNFNAKSEKTLFFPVQTFAGLERKTISLEYHYDMVAWHEDDQLFNYLDLSLDSWARGQLGWNMGLYFDYLYRNAALESVYTKYANGSDFSGLTSADHKFDLLWVEDILLGMEYEDIVDSETGMPSVACMTSPGVIYDIRRASDGEYRTLNSFTEEGRRALLEYGISGVYMGVGFIPTRANVLWNTGAITSQVSIGEPINTLDGVAATANSQGWNAGQSGIKNYIQCVSGSDLSSFAAGDIITIHRERGSANGVANGVLFTDGMADHRVVISANDSTDQIVIDKPWLKDGYTTPLADGSYGYVTKAAHVHLTSFIADSSALQLGVAQPPEMHEAPPIDNVQKQHRVSWDAHLKAILMNHGGMRNVFTRGSYVAPGPSAMTPSA